MTDFSTIKAVPVPNSERNRDITPGLPAGRDGKDGVGIAKIEQGENPALASITLTNGRVTPLTLPRGAPGVTPSLTKGTVTTVSYGGQANFSVDPTGALGGYTVSMTLVSGPAPWVTPAPWAANTVYTAIAPASAVTNGGRFYVCSTSHTSGSSFDASKWTLIAEKGADGNGNLNGPASSTDGDIAVFDGVTGKLIKDSGKKIADIGGSTLNRSARTSNTQLVAADKGGFIDITSGSFAQTFDASANLGAGWWLDFKNSGPSVIALDPNGSETIDGRSFINAYPGESFIIQCDGTSLRTIGRARRLLISDVTLTTAAASIDVEAFAGDTELYSLDIEGMPVTNTGTILFKKGGAYVALNSGTYSNTRIQGSSGSASGSTSASPISMQPANLHICSLRNLQTSASNGLKLSMVQGDGLNSTFLFVGTESTAGLLQGLRLLGVGGNLGVGTNFRVWGNR